MAIIRRGRENEPGLSQQRQWEPGDIMRDLLQWDPFRELTRGFPGGAGGGGSFVPSFEVKETKDAYRFKADLPGVKEEDLDIALTGNRLTISGERSEEKREEDETFYAYERSYGTFSRSFTLPEGVDVEHIHGELNDGVLQVVVPKKAEVQPRRIALRAKSEGEKKAKA